VLILFTEPGRKAIQGVGSLSRWLLDKSYELLASRFPKSIGLPGYRKRVRKSDLSRIEHPIGPGETDDFSVTLEQAFAPVAVMTGDGEDRIELFPFAAAHNRFLVLGGPGNREDDTHEKHDYQRSESALPPRAESIDSGPSRFA